MPPSDADVRETIEHKNAVLTASVNAGKLDRLLRDYYSSEPIIAYSGRDLMKGRDAVRQAWREMAGKGTLTFETEKLERSCDLVTEMGRWKFMVEPKHGDFRQEEGRYFVVWHRAGDDWRVVMQSLVPNGFQAVE